MWNNVLWLDSGASIGEKFNVELMTNEAGLRLMKWQGYYLQSPYNPTKEAERIVDANYQTGHLHILFGIGAGHIANSLVERLTEEDQLLIIEPSKNLFERGQVEGCFDFVSDHPRIKIIVGFEPKAIEEVIINLVVGMYFGKTKVIESPNYNKIFLREIKQLYELIRDASRLVLININTSNLFAKQWHENHFYNLCQAWETIPFGRYLNRFTCPVIIVASGPSLSKQLDTLKTITTNALIICAGSSINPLLRAGIKPHLIVTIDGGDNNFHHFENLQIDDIPLAYSLNVHKGIPRMHQGLQIVFNCNEQNLSEWVSEIIGEDLGYVIGGPSVANYCFDVARQVSSGPICFIGQDLAYTNNATHAAGNKNTRKVTDNEIESSSKYIYAEGYFGDRVLTDHVFLGMRRSFELQIKKLKKEGDLRAVINATEGGLNITGALNNTFSQFIKDYCQEDFTGELAVLQRGVKGDYGMKVRIQKSLRCQVPELQEAAKYAKRALAVLGGISKDNSTVDTNVLKKLDKIDAQIQKTMDNNLLHYVFLPTLLKINYFFKETNNETEVDRNKRILGKSEALYGAILSAATYTLELLEKVLLEEEDSQ